MNMNILCECVRMLLFFLILSEKYARYYYDLSSSFFLFFALMGFFFLSFTFFSIWDFLSLMLDTLLHYYET